MSKKYFGTDGVRGKVGEFPITPDFALKLGVVLGTVLHRQLQTTSRLCVLIGKDTRLSGDMLEAALMAGLHSAGVDTISTGVIPTPGVAYLTRANGCAAGVVISASHNPYYDNGIKIFSATGTKLPDAIQNEIEQLLASDLAALYVANEQIGRNTVLHDAHLAYREFCKASFPTELNLSGLSLVLDCAHGATTTIAPQLFAELGARIYSIGVDPNGININEACGATHLSALQQAVLEKKADLGLAFDGDGDRLMMVGANGEVYDGDQLLYVMLQGRLATGKVDGLAGVVGTLMSNLGLENLLKAQGIEFVRAKVGDRYVVEKMLEKGWLLGGENSGHLLCLDKHSTGDGIIAALQVLATLSQFKQPLSRVVSELQMYPQCLINVRIERGIAWQGNAKLLATVQEVEARLGERGRVLIRASGTEPLLRVMVEGEDRAEIEAAAQHLAEVVSLVCK